jgi:hypothetical protein
MSTLIAGKIILTANENANCYEQQSQSGLDSHALANYQGLHVSNIADHRMSGLDKRYGAL